MLPKQLAQHKIAPKSLAAVPVFRRLKKGHLPKPLHKIGGARFQATDVLPISDTHRAVFMWRDGELLTDSAFFGYLFQVLEQDELFPLAEFHLHPSHKGLHIKVPCNTTYDYRQRLLPGAPELALSSGVSGLDPRKDSDRIKLIDRFCKALGIVTGVENGLWS